MKLLHLVHVCLGYLIGWENPQIITDYDYDYGHGHGQGYGYGSRSRYYGYSGHRYSPFLEEPVLPPPPPSYILVHNKPIIPQRIIPITSLPNHHQHTPTPKSIILTTLLPPSPMAMQSAIKQHPVLTNKPFFTKLTATNKNIINVGKDAFCDLKCTIPLKLELTCGTNGVTYYNRDELRCAKRMCFPDLKLAYTGKCVDNWNSNNNNAAGLLRDEIDIDGDGVTGKENIEQVSNSNNFLDKGMRTDGPTIFGRIEETTRALNSYYDIDIDIKSLNFHNRDMSNGISGAGFSGTGPTSVKTKNKAKTNGGETLNGIGQNQISEKQLDCDVDQCSCSFNLLQVCGTDGRTYGNACFLNCMQACDPELRKYHNGACRISSSLGVVGGEGVIVPRANKK